MTQRFPLPTVFLRSTQLLIENLFSLPSAPGGQRSGTARGQPPWSCDGSWNLLKGTLVCQTPIDTTLWTRLSDTFRFGKALQWKTMRSVWVSSGLIAFWVYHLYHPALSVKVQPLIKLLQNNFPLQSFPLPLELYLLCLSPANSLELYRRSRFTGVIQTDMLKAHMEPPLAEEGVIAKVY